MLHSQFFGGGLAGFTITRSCEKYHSMMLVNKTVAYLRMLVNQTVRLVVVVNAAVTLNGLSSYVSF
jgi:hypothetical protein